MTNKYTQDAKERIINADINDFMEVIHALDKGRLEVILKHLPKLNGFRSGKGTDIRLNLYFKRSSSWNDKDWSLLQNIWLAYTEYQSALYNIFDIQNKKMLEKVIDELLSSSEKRQEVIEKSISQRHIGNITQKSLTNWILFSPFPKDEAVDKLLTFVPKENPSELKSKISSLEAQIYTIKKESVQVSQLHSTNKLINNLNLALMDNSKELNKTKKELEQIVSMINEIEKIKSQDIVDIKAQNELNQSLQTGYTEFKTLVKDLRNEINLINNSVNKLDLNQEKQNFCINNLIADNENLNTSVEMLMKEIDDLKSVEIKTEKDFDNITKDQNYNETKVGFPNNIKHTDIVNLNSLKESVKHLEINLNLLGIKLPHARRLSREIMAGLVSGQMVSFQGSLASMVAERCASCLTGDSYRIIKIPYGCIDSSIDAVIERIIEEYEAANSPTAVILEGINRSAFDIYGLSISQFIIDRIFQVRPNYKSLLLFSTISEGPSMLPMGSNLLELGPLLNIDSIKWMDKPSTSGPIGFVEKDIFNREVPSSLHEYNWDESIIPNWLYTLGGPLWRRSLIVADSYGSEMASTFDNPFEFSIFGWIIPMVVHLDSSKLVDFTEFVENDDRFRFLLTKYSPELVGGFEHAVY